MNIQNLIDEAVKIATREAMRGNPVRHIVYMPASTAAGNHGWGVSYDDKDKSAGDSVWWEL